MWRREAVEKGLRRAGALFFIGAVERLLFTRVAGVLRRLARGLLCAPLARIDAEFDAALYLRQFRNARRRSRAARDPALHYAILGWREHRAPNARFDPSYYRRVAPELKPHEEPFDHFLRIGRVAGAAQNETESARRGDPSTPTTCRALVLTHGRGGGSNRLLTLFERELVTQGVYPLRLRPLTPTSPSLFVCEEGSGETQVFDFPADESRLVAFARQTGVRSILVNHVVDMPPAIASLIVSASRALEVPFDMILHDYYAVCPRVNLIDDSGRFCDVAAVERCVACIDAAGAEVEAVDMANWRGRFADFLQKARHVFAPSVDLRQRLAAHIDRTISIWSPEDAVPSARWRGVKDDEALKIAVIGGLTRAKGAEVVFRLARAIGAASAPIELYLVGSSSNDRRLRAAGVTILGRYREDEIEAKLAELNPHIAFIPAIWPETWSFVLSQALSAGLPTAVFDIGAPAQRLRGLGRTELILPLEFAEEAGRLMRFFLNLRTELSDARQTPHSRACDT